MPNISILQINYADFGGGAEQLSVDLTQKTPNSNLLVGHKFTTLPFVIELPKSKRIRFLNLADKIARKLKLVKTDIKRQLFYGEEFNYTMNNLQDLQKYRNAKIIHLHNIHGGYFDLKALPEIAKDKKIVWTLHDMWAITGGESHVFENENYKKGKGKTPYINMPPINNPSIDRRNHYIQKKRKILSEIKDQIHLVCPSEWLVTKVRNSFVAADLPHISVIHNGVDTSIFVNEDSRQWKKPRVLVFNFPDNNAIKGIDLFWNIYPEITNNIDLIIVGEKPEGVKYFLQLDKINDRKGLNHLYNSVDCLVFPSLAENFPLTTLEAMASGLCVVCSDVCGIPEQVKPEFGKLFHSGNASHLLDKLKEVIADLENARRLGELASAHVKENFDLKIMVENYQKLYESI